MPFLGGFEIVDAWAVNNAVYVTIDTSYGDSMRYQLYAGRTLIGQTSNTSQTTISGQLNPSPASPPLTVVAVEPDNIGNDYGPTLPNWPSDRYELEFSTSGSPPDMDHFLITGSDAPGGAVDPNNVILRVQWIGDGPYTVPLPPLGQCGVWQFTVTPYSNAQPTGNPGTGATVSVTAIVPPADLVPDALGNRFEAAMNGSNLDVTFTYP
jgi:hypothetical protein